VNSQQIDYFLRAVKHLNFTKVANELYTSQPTISRQIALLEEELGFDLFRRDKGNLRLTVGGAIMAQEFLKASELITNAISRVGLVSEGLEGEISIGYLGGTNTDFFVFPPTFSFIKEYPQINVTMESSTLSRLREKLSSGELDIIFTFDFELPSIQNALHMPCYIVSAIIAMSSSHPLAEKEDLTMQDFSGQTFLLPRPAESESGRRDVIDVMKLFNVTDIKLRSMSNIESMLFGVRSGIGVALVDSSLDLIYDNRYRYIALPEENVHGWIRILAVWKTDNLNPVIPVYLEILKENLNVDETYKDERSQARAALMDAFRL